MSNRTGFTQKVRELLKKEGPKTRQKIMDSYGHLTRSNTIRLASDIHYLGTTAVNSGVYYYDRQATQAKKMLKKLRLENKERSKIARDIRIKKMYPYLKNYRKRRLPITGVRIVDNFTDFTTEHSTKEIWKNCGGVYGEIIETLNCYERTGLFLGFRRGGEKYYKLNPDSPFVNIADGLFEQKEEELDKRFKR